LREKRDVRENVVEALRPDSRFDQREIDMELRAVAVLVSVRNRGNLIDFHGE